MMKKYCLMLSVLVLSSVSVAGLTEIVYEVENVSGNQWVYNYTVTNLALTEEIEEFTIWCELGKYTSIQNVPNSALDANWDQITWQPNEAMQHNGGFDALTITQPIAVGESVSGFSVSFVWNGTGNPGRQYYEIVNPNDISQVLDSGFTTMIPEPSSLILLIGSSICLALKKQKAK